MQLLDSTTKIYDLMDAPLLNSRHKWSNINMNPYFYRADIVPYYPPEFQYIIGGWPHVCFSRITLVITVFVAIERCLCITMPLKVKTIITSQRFLIVVVSIYVVMIMTLIPAYVTINIGWKFVSQRNLTMLGVILSTDNTGFEGISLLMNLVMQIFFFLAIVTANTMLVYKLHEQTRWREGASGDSNKDVAMRVLNIKVTNGRMSGPDSEVRVTQADQRIPSPGLPATPQVRDVDEPTERSIVSISGALRLVNIGISGLPSRQEVIKSAQSPRGSENLQSGRAEDFDKETGFSSAQKGCCDQKGNSVRVGGGGSCADDIIDDDTDDDVENSSSEDGTENVCKIDTSDKIGDDDVKTSATVSTGVNRNNQDGGPRNNDSNKNIGVEPASTNSDVNTRGGNNAVSRARMRDQKLSRMILFLSTILFVCYLPSTVCIIVMLIEPEFSVTGVYVNAFFVGWSFAWVSDAINSSVNIFVYYKMSPKYRETFKKMFPV